MKRRLQYILLEGGILSPVGLLAAAAAISVLFLACEILGLRETTSIVSGTVPGWPAHAGAASLIALAYILAYSALVLVAPVLAIGAGVLALLRLLPYD